MKAVLCLFAVTALLASSVLVKASDADILNFALNLEYLEANFYSCAAFGVPLTGARIGGGPVATGCTGKALLSPEIMALATEIAKDEIAHVDFLRGALGPAAVAQPAINIGDSFAAAANAAFGKTLPVPFTGYGNDALFLHSAFIFEDVGVTAYQGAAPLIANNALVGPAAGILAVEAYHAGAIRAALLKNPYSFVFPYGVTYAQATAAIAALRDSVNGPAKTDAGIVTMDAKKEYIIAPVDANGITFPRLPSAVLRIVYLGGTNKGGFFPNGLNGVFTDASTSP